MMKSKGVENISLRDFVETGCIGGIKIGDTLRALGMTFDAPEYWEANWSDKIPLMWVYGDVEFILEPDLADVGVVSAIVVKPGQAHEGVLQGFGALAMSDDGLAFPATVESFKDWCRSGLISDWSSSSMSGYVVLRNGIVSAYFTEEGNLFSIETSLRDRMANT